MRLLNTKLVLMTVILSSSIMTGCGALGALGSLASLIPGGAKLTGGENDLFMTQTESAGSNVPYRAVPSSPFVAAPDPSKFYGSIGN